MTRLRILPLFVLVIAILLLAMGFMMVKTYEGRVGVPTPTVIQTQSPPVLFPDLYWIKIDPIGDKQVGDTFTITSTTNFSTGEDILVEVTEDHIPLCQKNSCAEYRHFSDTVKVMPGINGTNIISFTVNTSGFSPNEYFVYETKLPEGGTSTAVFNLIARTTQTTPVQPSIPRWWIRIDPIGDKQVGDVFTVTSTTNIPAGEEIRLELYDTYFQPGLRYTHFGCAAVLTVTTGKDGTNTTSYIVNSTAWRPWEYIVDETHDGTGTGGSTSFNITPGKTP